MGAAPSQQIESLCETFAAREAGEPAECLEIHNAPQRRSRLGRVEIDLSALCGQCFNRWIADRETRRREIAAWEERIAATVNPRWTGNSSLTVFALGEQPMPESLDVTRYRPAPGQHRRPSQSRKWRPRRSEYRYATPRAAASAAS